MGRASFVVVKDLQERVAMCIRIRSASVAIRRAVGRVNGVHRRVSGSRDDWKVRNNVVRYVS